MIHRYYKSIAKPLSAIMPALSFSSIITLTLGFSLVSTVVMAGTVSLPIDTLPSRITLPNVSPANSALANRGAYIARSADCMACHRDDYSGGVPIETPIGNIYSTNITPSTRYGIGNTQACGRTFIATIPCMCINQRCFSLSAAWEKSVMRSRASAAI